MRRTLLAVTYLFAAQASAAEAQVVTGTVQKIGVAKVGLVPTCPVFGRRNPIFKGASSPNAGALLPIIGGLAGDVAAAGLDALAAALETASHERAIGAEGRLNFEFYSFDTASPAIAVPRLGKDLTCLTIEIPGPHANYPDGLANWPPDGYSIDANRVISTSTGGALTPIEIDTLKRQFALNTPTLLQLEAEIVRMQDGFYVRPVYIHYAQKLDGAPSGKPLPAELHVKLATPSTASNGAAVESAFAIARVPLPNLKPGDYWWAEQISAQSPLLPFRTDEGSAAVVKLALAGATARTAAEEERSAAEVRMAHAIGVRYDGRSATGCVEQVCPAHLTGMGAPTGKTLVELVTWARSPASGVPAGNLSALVDAEKARNTAVLAIDQSTRRVAAMTIPARSQAGSTTLEARLILVRSANKFGLAIASALKKQGPPLSTAVSGIITKDHPGWTQAKSDLATAKLTVIHKQHALDRANAGADAESIEQAESSLLQAKLDVNLKASALAQPIPYPELSL